MTERFGVRIAHSAMADIEKISRWWHRHRPAAPRLFDRELDRALELLEAHPQSGARAPLKAYRDVRRVVLPRSGYLVIYRVLETEREVWIVRVRSARRRQLSSR